MTIIQSILLGIVQGLTEFLPVSSSGHLVLVPFYLNWQIPADEAFVFDVLVQVATLLAVVAYFWRDLVQIASAWLRGIAQRRPFAESASRTGWMILLATLPAGFIGLLLKDAVEAAFDNPLATGGFLLVTAALLLVAERLGKRESEIQDLTWQDALWIGLAQALAIFPGVSRSGATMAGGMGRNLKRAGAARFSFLMSIPIMLAAGLAALRDLSTLPEVNRLGMVFLPGFLAAAVTGYFSIRWLLSFLTRRPLIVFAVYCALVGIVTILVTV